MPHRLVVTGLKAVAAVLLLASVAAAQPVDGPPRSDPEARARTAPLLEAIGMDALATIMREEGIAHAEDLRADLFPDRGAARWTDMVEAIYETERMHRIMLDEMAADTKPWHLDPLLDFFRSDLGKRIVSLEISARRALLEPAVEEAAAEYLAELRSAGDVRLTQIDAFAEINNLVDMNVSAALNANFAFYLGLENGGGFGYYRGEEDILRDVYAQEEAVRADTQAWVFGFLALAYQPLSDADLDAYIALSRTEAGQALNRNLFAAFDELFRTISYELGMAAAQFIGGEEL